MGILYDALKVVYKLFVQLHAKIHYLAMCYNSFFWIKSHVLQLGFAFVSIMHIVVLKDGHIVQCIKSGL